MAIFCEVELSGMRRSLTDSVREESLSHPRGRFTDTAETQKMKNDDNGGIVAVDDKTPKSKRSTDSGKSTKSEDDSEDIVHVSESGHSRAEIPSAAETEDMPGEKFVSPEEKAMRKQYTRYLRIIPDRHYNADDFKERYTCHERLRLELLGRREAEAEFSEDKRDTISRTLRTRLHKTVSSEREKFAEKRIGTRLHVRSPDIGSMLEARLLGVPRASEKYEWMGQVK